MLHVETWLPCEIFFHCKKKVVFALNLSLAIGVGSGSLHLHTMKATGLGIFSRVC